MKKIIKAETAWRNAMNALINDYYDCDTCCEDLGAIGENECYQLYNGMHEYVFTKVGDVFKQFEFTDASAEYLLLTNWHKLNPKEDWYDKERTFRFLLEEAQGHNVLTDIDITTLIWMGIYTEGDMIHVTEYKDKEIEVTTDEIIATQREFIERCKGKTLEEIRDTFDGYNWGEYGEGTFDLIFKGFVFSIYKDEKGDGYYLSKVVLDEECRNEGEGETFTLPYLPKEIKVEEEPKPTAEIKRDGEFVDHLAQIWEQGHKTICVELSGEKYIINGLFTNEDVIIDVYIADTMQRIDRYFVIGAQELAYTEAEWYYDYFVKKVVKDRNINECWDRLSQ